MLLYKSSKPSQKKKKKKILKKEEEDVIIQIINYILCDYQSALRCEFYLAQLVISLMVE